LPKSTRLCSLANTKHSRPTELLIIPLRELTYAPYYAMRDLSLKYSKTENTTHSFAKLQNTMFSLNFCEFHQLQPNQPTQQVSVAYSTSLLLFVLKFLIF